MADIVHLSKLSELLHLDRSNTRKFVLKSGFQPLKVRDPETRQLVLALSVGDAEAVIAIRRQQGFGGPNQCLAVTGEFYIIQVAPELKPGRVKLGFTTDLSRRLAAYRTLSPTAWVMRSWPCEPSWEQAAMDSLTRVDCQCIGGEVFDCADTEQLLERGTQFFSIMPKMREVDCDGQH